MLPDLSAFLKTGRPMLIGLLENPLIVEHDGFSETLLAVFHLAEELESREEFESLPKTDLAHLGGDMTRAYRLLVGQWIGYMEHLHREYPYLYSLAMRKNPFNPETSPVVR